MNHNLFMHEALILAETALDAGDFPVGCVIVHHGTVIARGLRTGTTGDGTNEIDHAEINALRRLDPGLSRDERGRMIVYATMEPCLMCFAAILLCGIRHIVYAFEDPMGGGTACDRSVLPTLYRDADLTLTPGVMRAESLALFRRFFQKPDNRYWKDSPLARYILAAR
ncbi:nucleoside deaminase [Desulfatiferula olefinivorans]